jgi:hypothetical protein
VAVAETVAVTVSESVSESASDAVIYDQSVAMTDLLGIPEPRVDDPLEAEIADSVDFLGSDAALRSIDADTDYDLAALSDLPRHALTRGLADPARRRRVNAWLSRAASLWPIQLQV